MSFSFSLCSPIYKQMWILSMSLLKKKKVNQNSFFSPDYLSVHTALCLNIFSAYFHHGLFALAEVIPSEVNSQSVFFWDCPNEQFHWALSCVCT